MYQSVEPVAVFAQLSESRNVQVVMKLTIKLNFPVQCIVAPVRDTCEHAFFAKIFHATYTLKKD
jgi:hypothetical protein